VELHDGLQHVWDNGVSRGHVRIARTIDLALKRATGMGPFGDAMATETTYTHARANLAALCAEVTSTREPIVIRRRGSEDVVLVAVAELRSARFDCFANSAPRQPERPGRRKS
jgi:prevent-host-death family protein